MVSNIFSKALKLRSSELLAPRPQLFSLPSLYGCCWIPKDISINFKSKFSVSSTSLRPSGVHETMISKLFQELRYLRSTLPHALQKSLTISLDQPVTGFKGDYGLSGPRCPDLMVQYQDIRDKELKKSLIVEVGFSQSYPKLKERMKLWIEGTETVSVAMLIKIIEGPRDINPPEPYCGRELNAQLPPLTSMWQDDVRHAGPDDPSSALLIHGMAVAGPLSAFCEVWGRNKDGKAELVGKRALIYGGEVVPALFEILLNVFMPPAQDVEGKKLVLNWEEITEDLELERRILARSRYHRRIK